MINKLIYSFVFIALVGLIGVGYIRKQNTEALKRESFMTASWNTGYADIADITQVSDVIALVKVIGMRKTWVEEGFLILSDFDVEVMTPVYGTEQGESLIVHMTGGIEENGSVVEIRDDPLLQPGEEFLIFARRNASGTVTILGGPQGRLAYENGRLNSLISPHASAQARSGDGNLSGFHIDVRDAAFEDILGEIQTTLAVVAEEADELDAEAESVDGLNIDEEDVDTEDMDALDVDKEDTDVFEINKEDVDVSEAETEDVDGLDAEILEEDIMEDIENEAADAGNRDIDALSAESADMAA